MKTCTKCKVEYPLSEFYKSKNGKDGKSTHCKTCTKKRTAKSHDPNRALNNKLKRLYNITLEDYDNMLEAQDYKCAICSSTDPGKQGRFVVDHNHETEEVRGLLCWSCNVGIGHMKDDPNVLLSAAQYLFTNGYYG